MSVRGFGQDANVVTGNVFLMDGGNKLCDPIVSGTDGACAFPVNSLLESSSSTLFNFGNTDFTIRFWFKPNSLTGVGEIVNLHDTGANSLSYRIRKSNDDIQVFIDDDGVAGGGILLTASTVLLSTAVYYHIVFVHDAANDDAILYVDDSVADSDLAYSVGTYSQNIPLRVGALENLGGTNPSCIDDLAVYSKAFTAGEVTTDYNSGTKLTYAGADKVNLISWWTMDEASAPLIDSHGSSNLVDAGTTPYSNGGATTSNMVDLIDKNLVELINGASHNDKMVFDGINDYAKGDFTDFNFERTDTFSVEVIFNTTAQTGTIIGNELETASDNIGWELLYNVGVNRARVRLTNESGVNEIKVDANIPVLPNADYHWIMTYDGSSTAAGVKNYINGVLVSNTVQDDTLSLTIVDASQRLHLGMRNGLENPFSGNIDSAEIYNIELTATQAYSKWKAIKNRLL